ncbi:MAG: hypothetical protein PVF83_19265 [Anaerolineales bacterium]|jgi:hypothetical protein
MRFIRNITHPKSFPCFFLALGMIALLTAGCTEYLRIQSSPNAGNLPGQDTSPPTGEETPLSISDITGLPEHAPTVTVEERPIETSIGDASFETPPSITSEPAPAEDGPAVPAPYIPDADILILKPGDYSIMVSPFRLSAYLEPGFNHLVDLRLVGENGSVLVERSVRVFPWEGASHATMVAMIEFEIPDGSLEAARLEISTTDEFGRPKAMNSIELILMSQGESMRNYAESLKEKVVIQYPLENTLVQGDTLLLSGLVKSPSETPLSIELITETGEIIAASEAAVLLSEDSEYALFAAEVHYDITEPTWVRLVISVPADRIPGLAYIKTRELLLYP